LQIATAAMVLIGMSEMADACFVPFVPPNQLFCNADGSCPNGTYISNQA